LKRHPHPPPQAGEGNASDLAHVGEGNVRFSHCAPAV
jgi:hypothetical protein